MQEEAKYTFRAKTSKLELEHMLAIELEEQGWGPLIRPFRVQLNLRTEGFFYIVIKIELFLRVRDGLILWVSKSGNSCKNSYIRNW